MIKTIGYAALALYRRARSNVEALAKEGRDNCRTRYDVTIGNATFHDMPGGRAAPPNLDAFERAVFTIMNRGSGDIGQA